MRLKCLAALCVLLLLLTGCASTYEYLQISEHNDPFAYKEEAETSEDAVELTTLTAGNYYSLRSALSNLVRSGIEHSQIQLEQYSGDAETDLKKAVAYLTEEDPIGAYAVDYITFDCKQIDGRELAIVDAVYRRSAGEIAAIQSVRGTEQAEEQIFSALDNLSNAITLRVSGYVDHDYEASIHQYCITHPDRIPELPAVSAAVYPQSGNVRILELHLSYDLTKEEMHNELAEVNGVFSSAYNYLRYGQTQRDKIMLACSYLAGRFDYQADPDASVYQLLCRGNAGSLATASAFYYICQRGGVECRIVEGSREGQPYCWNILLADGVWYHADILQAELDSLREPRLRLDGEMSGYQWDRESYPVCNGEPVSDSE